MFCPSRTTMFFGDYAHEGESQSHATRIGSAMQPAGEPLEQGATAFRLDPRSVINNADDGIIASMLTQQLDAASGGGEFTHQSII